MRLTREQVLAAGATAGVLLLTLGMVLFFGVSAAAYVAVASILVALVGSVAYTWWEGRSDTSVQGMKLGLLERVKERIQKLEAELKLAEELVKTQHLQEEVKEVRARLIKDGLFTVVFDVNDRQVGRMTLTAIELSVRRAEQKLRSTEAVALAEHAEAVEPRGRRMLENGERLRDAGFRVGAELEELERVLGITPHSLAESLGRWERLKDTYMRLMEVCVEELEYLIEAAAAGGRKVEPFMERLQVLRRHLRTPEAVDELIALRAEVGGMLARPFTKLREQLLGHLTRVKELVRGDASRVRELEERAKELREPSMLGELSSLREECITATVELIEGLADEVERMHRELESFGIRRRWRKPQVPESARTFAEFSRRALRAMERLAEEYDACYTELKVMSSYPAVERIIERKLKEKGEVAAEELGVRYAEEFLQRYASMNKDVKLVRKQGRLKVRRG